MEDPNITTAEFNTNEWKFMTNPDEVGKLLAMEKPVCYDGFEPSGRLHIGHTLYKAAIVKKLVSKGVTFIFWIADTHSTLSGKSAIDHNKMKILSDYMIAIWKACGLEHPNVKFLRASEEIEKNPLRHHSLVTDISTCFSLSRIMNCCDTISNRREKSNRLDRLNASHILYPCMQCADVFFLSVDACQMGCDQTTINSLAIEYSKRCELKTPLNLSQNVLPGLSWDNKKMSRGSAKHCIYIDDLPEHAHKKIMVSQSNAYEENSFIMKTIEHIIIPWNGKFVINRLGEIATYINMKDIRNEMFGRTISAHDIKYQTAIQLASIMKNVQDNIIGDFSVAKRILIEMGQSPKFFF